MSDERPGIQRNAAQCLRCGDVIESRHGHDWVRCSCGAIYVDGGRSYLHWGGKAEFFRSLVECRHQAEPDRPHVCRWCGEPLHWLAPPNTAAAGLCGDCGEVWPCATARSLGLCGHGRTDRENCTACALDRLSPKEGYQDGDF